MPDGVDRDEGEAVKITITTDDGEVLEHLTDKDGIFTDEQIREYLTVSRGQIAREISQHVEDSLRSALLVVKGRKP